MDPAEFQRLVQLCATYDEEAKRCAEVGAYHAACVMVGIAVEGVLLATVAAGEPSLRRQGLWPAKQRRPPQEWRLEDLIAVARDAGWLSGRIDQEFDVNAVVKMMQHVRNTLLHPGRHLREAPETQLGQDTFEAAYRILEILFHMSFVALEDAPAIGLEDIPAT